MFYQVFGIKKHINMAFSKNDYQRDYMKKRRLGRKLKFIQLLGGKCVRCGDTDPSKLEFDHIKQKTKSFDISNAKDAPEKHVVRELKKCQLLCHDCHTKKTRENFEFGSAPAKHGTIWMYKRFKCRCDKCKKAMSSYLKELKRKKSFKSLKSLAELIQISIDKYGLIT